VNHLPFVTGPLPLAERSLRAGQAFTPRARAARLGLVLLALALATWQRDRAVRLLPPDFDELDYLPSGFRYAERMAPGRWGEIPGVTKNSEHPPLVKLTYGVAVKAAGAPEPDWSALRVGSPIPDEARPAFTAGRWASAVPGIVQVGVAAVVHPLAGLLLAVEAYHAKYTAQAYLEGLPGLFFVLAVLLFERATRGARGRIARPDPDPRLAAGAFALLGAAAAGKYPFGAVGVLALSPLALLAFPRRPLVWLSLAAATLAAFVALDPYLWPDPVGRIWESAAYHFRYGQSEHVKRAGLPWDQQAVWLSEAAPTKWHAGVFPLGAVGVALLPLAAIGFLSTARRRPVWAVQAAVSAGFLLAWPTKWPQYLVLALVPLAVCAAHAPGALSAGVRRLRARPAADLG
jgi:hypothetical protein